MAATSTFDPITFEVVRHALTEATEEMAVALRRSAYSTNIKTRADFSCAFFDRDLNVVAQAFCQAVHLGSLVHLVPIAVRTYGPENMGPGDAVLCNDPYLGGVHLNDISLISPVYCDGELLGYVANMAHHVDVGGGAPASVGAFREVYQEGIIIPPVKLVAGGQIVEDVFRLILGQIRSKRETAGDFRAQMAANATGARRLAELTRQTGLDTVNTYIRELMTYAERRTRAEIAKLPQGEFSAEGYVDNDGYTDEPVRLVAKVRIDDEGVLFDLNGSDPQRRAPVNSTFAQTFSACAYNLKTLMDPDIPPNQGFYQMVRIDAPEGTVVNCTPPAPVVGGWETHARLNEVISRRWRPCCRSACPRAARRCSATPASAASIPATASITASWRRSPVGTARDTGATARTPCRLTARIPRTPLSKRPSGIIPCVSCAMSWWTTRKAPASIAAGWDCAATTSSSTTTLPLPFWRIETRPAPGGSLAVNPAARPTISTITTVRRRS